MEHKTELQYQFCSRTDDRKFCSFDYEIIEEKTRSLLHQTSRFLYINKGKGKIKINEEVYDLKEHTLVALLPWDCSEIITVEETLQFYVVVYNYIVINDVIKALFNVDNQEIPILQYMRDFPVVHCDEKQHDQVKKIFSKIRDEVGVESTMVFPEERPYRSIYVVNLLTELMVVVGRIVQERGEKKEIAVSEIDKRTHIFRYIYTHLNEKLTLGRLAKIFYMSESSISKYILETTGLTFNNLVNEIKIAKTLSYLMYTDYTLEELAGFLGYVDAAHISKVFESRMESKISDYRKTYQTVLKVCNIKERRIGYQVVSYIVDNHKGEITPQQVATEFGITIVELNRILLLQVERNFSEFLNFLRVNSACELLVSTDMAITDIAIEVGYNTVKTFARNFVYYKHITPGNYRKEVKGLEKVEKE